MKQSIFYFCSAALVALAFSSCNRVETAQAPFHTVTFEASADEETKTAIVEGEDKASFKWSSDDADRLNVYENGVAATAVTLNLIDERHATISATFPDSEASEFEYTATLAKNRSGKNPSLPTTQKPKASSYDPDADILVAEAKTSASRLDKISLKFSRPAVINKLVFSGLPSDLSFQTVTISANKNIRGYYNLNSASDNKWTVFYKDIKISIDPTKPTDGKLTVWFVSAPVKGVTLTAKLLATNGDSYVKTFSKAVELKENKVTVLGVNMTGINPLPEESGAYVIANSDLTYIAENWNTWQYPNTDKYWIKAKPVTYNAEEDKIYYSPDDVTIDQALFTLTRVNTAGKYCGMYTIENRGWYIMKYAGSAHDSVPWIKASTGLLANDDLSYWEISEKDNGIWLVQATLYEDPPYGVFCYLSESSSGQGYPLFMAANSSANIKLVKSSKVQAIQ